MKHAHTHARAHAAVCTVDAHPAQSAQVPCGVLHHLHALRRVQRDACRGHRQAAGALCVRTWAHVQVCVRGCACMSARASECMYTCCARVSACASVCKVCVCVCARMHTSKHVVLVACDHKHPMLACVHAYSTHCGIKHTPQAPHACSCACVFSAMQSSRWCAVLLVSIGSAYKGQGPTRLTHTHTYTHKKWGRDQHDWHTRTHTRCERSNLLPSLCYFGLHGQCLARLVMRFLRLWWLPAAHVGVNAL